MRNIVATFENDAIIINVDDGESAVISLTMEEAQLLLATLEQAIDDAAIEERWGTA